METIVTIGLWIAKSEMNTSPPSAPSARPRSAHHDDGRPLGHRAGRADEDGVAVDEPGGALADGGALVAQAEHDVDANGAPVAHDQDRRPGAALVDRVLGDHDPLADLALDPSVGEELGDEAAVGVRD